MAKLSAMNSIRFAAGKGNPTPIQVSARPVGARDRRFLIWIAVALLSGGAAVVARAQFLASDRGAIASGRLGVIQVPPGLAELSESTANMTPAAREKLWKRLNAGRQQSMLSDVRKLLQLAGQLRAELGSTSPAAPSAEELRTVNEIQRLARKVKENMRDGLLPE